MTDPTQFSKEEIERVEAYQQLRNRGYEEAVREGPVMLPANGDYNQVALWIGVEVDWDKISGNLMVSLILDDTKGIRIVYPLTTEGAREIGVALIGSAEYLEDLMKKVISEARNSEPPINPN